MGLSLGPPAPAVRPDSVVVVGPTLFKTPGSPYPVFGIEDVIYLQVDLLSLVILADSQIVVGAAHPRVQRPPAVLRPSPIDS